MKLDKMTFAKLIAHCVSNGMSPGEYEVKTIDEIVDMPNAEQQVCYPQNENVENLMRLMAEGTRKIEAIKTHRAITGYGLKESKDAVERYWPEPKVGGWTLNELHEKLKAANFMDERNRDVIEAFLNQL